MQPHQVVIVGGGFGGLYTAKSLKHVPVQITVLDRRNFHLFQPLLYQVATGSLSPANIATPLRAILKNQRNTEVLLAEVTDIDVANKRIILGDVPMPYDTLIVASGVTHDYFGHNDWANTAPGLKYIEDATATRARILTAFEAAERETNEAKIREWLTFVVVGGGPTGVEMAGALGEIAHYTLKNNFRHIDPAHARILLIEGTDRILPHFVPQLSASATKTLAKLGVSVLTNTTVIDVQPDCVVLKHGDQTESVVSHTILWAAGVKASLLGKILADATNAELDRSGRIVVQPDLTLPGHSEIFVIGDLANFSHQNGTPLPGVAQVAMQQGRYAARQIEAQLRGEKGAKSTGLEVAFHYQDYGSMATIGRAAAVTDLGWIKLQGLIGWLAWLFIHILYLIEFENRQLVVLQWAWSYFTRNRAARLITGEDVLPTQR